MFGYSIAAQLWWRHRYVLQNFSLASSRLCHRVALLCLRRKNRIEGARSGVRNGVYLPSKDRNSWGAPYLALYCFIATKRGLGAECIGRSITHFIGRCSLRRPLARTALERSVYDVALAQCGSRLLPPTRRATRVVFEKVLRLYGSRTPSSFRKNTRQCILVFAYWRNRIPLCTTTISQASGVVIAPVSSVYQGGVDSRTRRLCLVPRQSRRARKQTSGLVLGEVGI